MPVALSPNLRDQIAAHLRRRILGGLLAPGRPLIEVTVSQEFGVSRGPIRDAFLTLSKEGLLIAKPNVGVRVAPAPSEFKRNLAIQLRRTIERTILTRWLEQPTAGLVERLEENLEEYKRVCHAGTDMDRVVEVDMDFHRLIVASVDDGHVVSLWQPIIMQTFLRYSRHRTLLESHAEHAGILAAIKARDTDTAIQSLVTHIQ